MKPPASFDDEQLLAIAADMLAESGFGGKCDLLRLEGGRNNRVFRVDTADRRFLLKSYFAHPNDPRDRLATEFAFCQFAWRHGLRNIPEPIASSRAANMAIYGYIDGRRLTAAEIDDSHVTAALEFYKLLNRHAAAVDAAQLPAASEACFSIREHLDCVSRRVAALSQIDVTTAAGREAHDLAARRLVPAWNDVSNEARSIVKAERLTLDEKLRRDQRCLSPSDFGFHNALVDESGSVFFIDFEYAGWDDPAKLICDFFCQVELPVGHEFLPRFTDAVASTCSDPHALRCRVRMLLPVYQLKWCCILLNEFLPPGGARRRFGANEADDARQREQLIKVRAALSVVEAHDFSGGKSEPNG